MDAQKVISEHRKQAVVVATFTAACEWPQVSTRPDLDLAVNMPMGKASSLGLGLALAQPGRKVLVLDGDGSLLMNLGTLVTIANMAPPNLVHFVFQNGVYRTTGGQPIPNVSRVSFVELAKAAGYANTYEFAELAPFKNKIEAILAQAGPTLVCLKFPRATEESPIKKLKVAAVLPRLMASLQGTD
ncbi:MAG: thiamine pyrophosphate-binding protein [Chloroflexi bacterium]|nr:thiamine pyrophosphate-binding protein [Chloroflexota bacterium]